MNLSTAGNGPRRISIGSKSRYEIELENSHIAMWLQSSLKRVYPTSEPEGRESIELITPRNAKLSFQACMKNYRTMPIQVECEAEAADGLEVQVRRVGYVPQRFLTHDTDPSELDGFEHVPGLVPDPLFPETKAIVRPYNNQSFWISVKVSETIKPGVYPLQIKFKSPTLEEEQVLTAHVDVRSTVLQQRKDFPVTHWWNLDCIYDWYKLEEPFSDEFFKLVRPYMQNMMDHGSNVIYISILNGRREIMKRPPQLLIVNETGPGQYEFDFSRVRKMVEISKEIGFEFFEWTHFWAYSHNIERAASAGNPTNIYTERDGKMELLFPPDLDGTGEVFANYMSQFLPAFKQFLEEEGILENSLFHICDEPRDLPEDIESYKRARKLLETIDPSIKVMDAVYSDLYAVPGLTDYPVPQAPGANTYLKKGIPHWVYYCMSPQGPYINRFFDTKLPKVRIQGLMFYKLKTLGFLHWGFNYWYILNNGFDPEVQVMIDPFTDGSAGEKAPYGDPFVVYPGAEGPIDSIRWEVFAEAMQDYTLLQTLGIKHDDELLHPIQSYSEFPKSEEWFQDTMRKLLS
ncbi:MAG: hypothetical protein K0R47_5418 [Brevibacillus sp.]|nr:hypothetical protein [Brevibacillus sp.]